MPISTSKRVAVIAVHGVADQKPGESADSVAALLLGCTQRNPDTRIDEPVYEPFVTHTIHVPLAPAVARAAAADLARAEYEALTDNKETLGDRMVAGFRETSRGYREMLHEASPDQADDYSPSSPSPERPHRTFDTGLAFMRLLLSRYSGDSRGRSYITSKLEGGRRGHGNDRREVDVYELYWADLSTLGRDPLRFFSSLYQVVLHLSDLGRRALEDSLADFRENDRWGRLLSFHAASVRLLTLPIPVLNLILLLALLGAIIARVTGGSVGVEGAATGAIAAAPGVKIAAVLASTIIFTALGYWFVAPPRLRAGERPIVRGWWIVPPLSIFSGAVLGYILVTSTARADILLIAQWWILSFFILSFVLNKYESVRPGAVRIGRLLFALAAAFFVWAVVTALDGQVVREREVEYATLWTLQFLFGLLGALWVTLVFFALVACGYSSWIIRGLTGDVRARAKSAVRTSRLALGISASAMLGILVIVWSALLAWGVGSVSVFDCMQVVHFPPLRAVPWFVATPEALQNWIFPWPDNATCPASVSLSVHGYFRVVLLMTTTSGLPISLLLVGLAFVLLLWMAMPSVRFEKSQQEKCANVEASRLGTWLSHGLNGTRAVTHLWWASVFVVLPLFAMGDSLLRNDGPMLPAVAWVLEHARALTLPLLQTGGSLVAASAAAIIFGIAKFGGSALDVVLDVDNYLRERPADSPPRARIAERYSSLLRHVANQKTADGKPYDEVIIVAHSLGALITVDLLRYLTAESEAGRGDPALAPLGIGVRKSSPTVRLSVFTMGNPLRQLLNRFFPHQYQWVRDVPDNADGPTEPLVPPLKALVKYSTPSASQLSVKNWSNAYRSGDYVGRSIWLEEWYNRTESPLPEAGRYPEPIAKITWPPNERVEMCIGVGAHTHYWDRTAPDVRDHLDGMIMSA